MAYTFSYGRGTWRGCDRFFCYDCAFDILNNEQTMIDHCRRNGHGVVNADAIEEGEYIAQEAPLPPRGVTVTLGYLCWNTANVSGVGVLALMREAARLERLGCHAHIAVVDNGSTDETANAIALAGSFNPDLPQAWFHRNSNNYGISVARNQIIDQAAELKSDYVLLLDGDIELVPLSSYTMARYLECHTTVGCIGAYAANHSTNRRFCAKTLREIPESRVKYDVHIAWTQYGLFRMSMFNNGIRFDEDGPFGEPGWGFEDDDLYYQMRGRAWGSRYFNGMTYLHRNVRSSLPLLEQSGVDIPAMFNKRKDYLLKKWSRRGFDNVILDTIKAQQLPG